MKKGTNKETVQGLLDNTWDSYPPEFYITFHWKNCPRELKTVINDTKFFNNNLAFQTINCLIIALC